jgi:tripartite-type tricarboxylate transporter receptor subunit TctC
MDVQELSVHSDLPVKTVSDLIAYAKANRGKLSYAVDATAGAAVFAGRLLNKRGDLGMAEIPYRSAAQMVQDTAGGGAAQVIVSSIIAANPGVQSGKLRRIVAPQREQDAFLAAHPDLYARGTNGRVRLSIRNGAVALGSLDRKPGLAVGVMPDWTAMTLLPARD